MIAVLFVWLLGAAYFTSADNAAANDLRRFWPALLLWPFVLAFGIGNSSVNRMQSCGAP